MHKMLVEGKTAVPELCPSLSADKLVMEDEAGKNGPECQYAQRNEHIPRAFMRVISASPYSYVMYVILMRRSFGVGLFFLTVEWLLYLSGSGPSGLSNTFQDHHQQHNTPDET